VVAKFPAGHTVEAKFGSHLAKSRAVLETESFDTLKQMLLSGAGATFIPKYLIKNELKAGMLAEIAVKNTKLPITFSFVTKKHSDLSKATEVFRTKIFEHFIQLKG
jgi:DNA-binding transcriptional LysR family regulator